MAVSLHRSAARVGRGDGDAGDREGRRLRPGHGEQRLRVARPRRRACSGGGSFHAGTPGPNGLAVSDGIVVGSTDERVFALDADDGHLLWSRRILRPVDSFVDVAPLVVGGLVYTATTGYGPGTRPAIFALDERTGAVRWRFDTIRGAWAHPKLAGGGGTWQTPSLVDGTLYAGTANPLPWGGSPQLPNGGAFAGRALYTDSLLALGAADGSLRWFDQVTPHDVRDHDFQNSPIVSGDFVVGSGKGGRVIAWDRKTHVRRWSAVVGVHRNDVGPLPSAQRVRLPGPARGSRDAGSGCRRPRVRRVGRPLLRRERDGCCRRELRFDRSSCGPRQRDRTRSLDGPPPLDRGTRVTALRLHDRRRAMSSSCRPSTVVSAPTPPPTGACSGRLGLAPASTRARRSRATRCTSRPAPASGRLRGRGSS